MFRGRGSFLVVLISSVTVFLTLLQIYLKVAPNLRRRYANEFGGGEKIRKLPDCIIIGAKKGGTRALLEFINIHPDVEISPFEVHFFNMERQYSRGLHWSQMPLAAPGQLVVEKSPNYFVSRDTPGRIFEINKDIKLVLAVREPVERAISDFVQSYQRHNLTFERLAFKDGDGTFESVNTAWSAIKTSSYARHLERWLEVFPRAQILVVECGDLTADPAGQLRRVERFLGLRPHISQQNFFFSRQKGFMCWRRGPDDPGHCLGDRKGLKHPEVHPAAVARLRRHFSALNKRFFELVGTEFNWPQQ
ncbi:heparan sulfate glucosamine 3-O-sulfotransferase 3B1-like isoform X2 [Neocloeon triangulifer]|uniref:heparan sulfate glucosamine 3-O-sulfotransferase 3B1-like isoform X2 n=1 Tax=Neocloeon triangulifer TaxID=2078957 RepID=UPI00286F5F87|nr:heparan sulfate glucosamine 3-O-sulfotransferase 3B1-like isoform X2 [Neocloeon triangulifer]